MKERAVHIRVVAWSTLLESLRRQDLYVVWILALFGLGAGHVMAAQGVRGFETFARSVTMSVIDFLSILICIWLAGRQIPEELSRRTLYPLLARPVRRLDVLLGKALAVWTVSTLCLLILALIGWVDLWVSGAGIGPIYWQYVTLRALSFGPIATLTIALTLLLSGPAAVTIAALLTLFGTVFARTLADVIRDAPALLQLPLKALYFVLPHLDLFDLSQRAMYDYPPVPAWSLVALAAYALAYVLVFLGLGELKFRRTPL